MVTTPTLWKDFTQANTAEDPAAAGFVNAQLGGPVLALPDGGYVVIWTDYTGTHNPGGAATVGQKFDVFGQKVGGEVSLSLSDAANATPLENGSLVASATLLSDGTIAVLNRNLSRGYR